MLKHHKKMLAQSLMKFMDIPMDGDLETFKEKLTEKEIQKDSYNKRGFSGFFFGTFSGITITDNKSTGNVYKAMVRYNESMTRMSQNQIVELYKKLCQSLKINIPKQR